MNPIAPLHTLDVRRFESSAILKRLAAASRQLAELKGVAASIPHQGILINTLGIVAWHEELAPAGGSQVVVRDAAFADDVARTNLAAILVQHGLERVRSL